MRFFPRLFTIEESNTFINDNQSMIDTRGWGAWALEVRDTQQFVGFVGFSEPALWHPCAGEIDIGWRLASEFWNKGYATEAARCALDIGFTMMKFSEVVSFTSGINQPSISVMRKIGMTKDTGGFEHPRIDSSDPLCSHVVYRITSQMHSQHLPA